MKHVDRESGQEEKNVKIDDACVRKPQMKEPPLK